MRRKDDMTLLRDVSDGLMVIHVTREGGYFSVICSVYASRRAYELGNTASIHSGGSMHEQILKAAPELAPIVALHLADAETGEPMHGPANGWYALSGANMASSLESSYGGYHDAPEPYVGEWLNPAYAQFFLELAARSLACTVEELPNTQDEDVFTDWVTDLRWRWLAAARQANEWIDEHETHIEEPAEATDETEFSVELEAGLRVSASLDEHRTGFREGVGPHHLYDVEITDGTHTYKTQFGGSVSDYEEGRVNAREAGMLTLNELAGFLYEDARDKAESYGMDLLDEDERETFEAMQEQERVCEEMRDALEANLEAIGA